MRLGYNKAPCLDSKGKRCGEEEAKRSPACLLSETQQDNFCPTSVLYIYIHTYV